MKLLLSSWMKEIDSRAINDIGIPSIILMENASRAAANFFSAKFPSTKYKNVAVVVGKGNNGGDGLASGRILGQKGYQVEFFLISSPDNYNPDPKINYEIIKNLKLKYTILRDGQELKKKLNHCNPADTFIIDALFGTGINQPVQDDFYSPIIKSINESGLKVASIDVPSGISEHFLPPEGDHVIADATVTFQCPKLSHLYPDGNKFCGQIQVVDIGIPHSLLDNPDYYIQFIHPASFRELFKKREIDTHKGHYGHCLNISGSLGKPGAGILSSYAILRSGAGLCTIAAEKENRTLAVQSHPEIMTLTYKGLDEIIQRLDEFNCILMGPGLGNTRQTYDLTTRFIQYVKVPLILDADAVNIFEMGKEFLKVKRDFPIILTPHPGEFSRVTGVSIQDIQKNRIQMSRDFAREYNVYLILKGHHTIIATPEGNIYVNETGNAGMATAGSGDVLSGIITGMISQFHIDFSLDQILQAAVFIHGFAGDLASDRVGEMGVTASEILKYVPEAIIKCDDFKTHFPYTV